MRPKARQTTQHGGPRGWLEEKKPTGRDLPDDGCFRGRPVQFKYNRVQVPELLNRLSKVNTSYMGSCRLGGNSICSALMTSPPRKETLDSLRTFSSYILHLPS
jgi:hypothetical protein